MLPSKTLTQYLLEHLAGHPDQQTLTLIMADLAVIGKVLSPEINRAGAVDILGAHALKM